jgi:hypothetical protein
MLRPKPPCEPASHCEYQLPEALFSANLLESDCEIAILGQ